MHIFFGDFYLKYYQLYFNNYSLELTTSYTLLFRINGNRISSLNYLHFNKWRITKSCRLQDIFWKKSVSLITLFTIWIHCLYIKNHCHFSYESDLLLSVMAVANSMLGAHHRWRNTSIQELEYQSEYRGSTLTEESPPGCRNANLD